MNFHFPFTVKLPEFGCFCQAEEGEVLLRSAPLFGGLSLWLRGGGLERRGHLDQRLDGKWLGHVAVEMGLGHVGAST